MKGSMNLISYIKAASWDLIVQSFKWSANVVASFFLGIIKKSTVEV